jgi:hypothetical protein
MKYNETCYLRSPSFLFKQLFSGFLGHRHDAGTPGNEGEFQASQNASSKPAFNYYFLNSFGEKKFAADSFNDCWMNALDKRKQVFIAIARQ